VISATIAHLPTLPSDQKKDVGQVRSFREDGRGVRVTVARDRGVRGSVAFSSVGRKRPRS